MVGAAGAFCRALPVMSRIVQAPQRAARPALALRHPAQVIQRRSLTSTRVCAQAGLQKEVLKAGDGATFPKTGQKVGCSILSVLVVVMLYV